MGRVKNVLFFFFLSLNGGCIAISVFDAVV